jgi:effector-binding domain-containing protein
MKHNQKKIAVFRLDLHSMFGLANHAVGQILSSLKNKINAQNLIFIKKAYIFIRNIFV